MSRIGSYGASQMYLSRLMAIQQRIAQEQIQVSTEKKSTNYTGIAADANRLINIENEKTKAESFIKSNDMATTRLKAADISMTAIEKTMKEFRDRLDDFAQNATNGQQEVEALQKWAYQAMMDMKSYLAANVDGQYIFSGGRVSDEPVQLPANSLAEFQQIYDGDGITYPTTRAAALADIHTDDSQTGDIQFGAGGVITADTSSITGTNVLANLPVGARITIGGGVNDGKSFTVQSVTVDGTGDTIITVTPAADLTAAAAAGGISIDANSWYKGDTIQIQQRIDTDRIIDLGVYASDPAFEKAFRAMGLIAQGAYGTPGGLDQNLERVDQARFLIKDAISRNGTGLGPFGQEQSGDLEQLQTQVGVSASMIATKNAKHQSFAGFLDQRIIGLENVDKTEAVTRLLDDQTALQTSYQALASIRQLSLLNYMK
jgi:Flagellin and related hook-associated proteins